MMVTFFNILTNVIIVIGMISMCYFMIMTVFEKENTNERIKRIIALCLGFLIYFAARALGLSIPELLFISLQVPNPFFYWFLSAILPGLTGSFVAWYFIKVNKKKENLLSRMIILFSTFIFFSFSDVYFYTFNLVRDKLFHDKLLPNVTFIIGVGLYTIFSDKS